MKTQGMKISVKLPKRPYKAPELMVFGHVAKLTQSGTNCDRNDNSTETCGLPPHDMYLMPSDYRLKENIKQIGRHPQGYGLYLFDYKPEYRDAFGHGRQFGVMAQEVETVMPQAVVMHPDGYKMVDYAMLGISRAVH